MTPEANIDRPESMNEKERLEQKLQDWESMRAFLLSEEGRKKYGDDLRDAILERVAGNIAEIEESLMAGSDGTGSEKEQGVRP